MNTGIQRNVRKLARIDLCWFIVSASIAASIVGCSSDDSGDSGSGGSSGKGKASGGGSGFSGSSGTGGGFGGASGTGTGGGFASGGASGTGTGGSSGVGTGGSGVGGTGGVDGAGGTGTGGTGTGGTGAGGTGTGGTGTGGTGTGGTGTGGTGTGGTGTGGTGTGGTGGSGGSGFPPVSDFAAPGPFPTTSGAGGTACTIFRPSTLGQNGLRHPIIVWGNGTFSSPQVYAAALTHWASHGFIVAAANTSNAGTGTDMKACLDFVIAENTRAGSAYQGKVDPDHVGTSGHSQGGGGSIMLGRDPRITVTAPLQPYVQGLGHQASSQSQQSGPMFLMSGSADTIASPATNQQPVYNNANVPVFWGTLANANHTGSATGNISGYRGPSTAWFRLHLMGDESARSLFYGASCGLCTHSSWTVQRKNIN